MNNERCDGLPAAVIFDMDGVLIDSEPIHVEGTRLLLEEHGVTFVPDPEENFYGRTDREVLRALRLRYSLAATERELASAWIAKVVALLSRPLSPLAGVPDVLRLLQRAGVRIALASSSAPAIIAATLSGLGLAGAFELTVSGHDVERGKPAPDIFLEAARRLGLPPADCLVIEDSANGVCAAVAAGSRCVAVPCASTSGQDFARATVRLDSLAELPGWLGIAAP